MILKILKEKRMIVMMVIGVNAVLYAFVIFFIAHGYTKNHLGEWLFYTTCTFLIKSIRNGLINTGLIRFLLETKDKKNRNELIGSGWIS